MFFFSLGLIHDTAKATSGSGNSASAVATKSFTAPNSKTFGLLATKNLLGLKVNVFKFLNNLIFKGTTNLDANGLFPPLFKSTIVNLSNQKNQCRLPVNCAADDLELSLGGANDQIEFFNNIILNGVGGVSDFNSSSALSNTPNSGNFGNGSNNFYGTGLDSNELPEFDDFYEAHSHHNTHTLGGHSSQFGKFKNEGDELFAGKSMNFTVPLPQSFHHHQIAHNHQEFIEVNKANITLIPNASLSLSKSYSNSNNGSYHNSGDDYLKSMNVVGLSNDSPYFNDFMHNEGRQSQAQDDYFSSSVSSSESYISPLDDEFFKKFNSVENTDQLRMNSTTSSFSNVDVLFDDEDDVFAAVDDSANRKRKIESISSGSSVASVVSAYNMDEEQFLNNTSSSLQALYTQAQSKNLYKIPPKKYRKSFSKEKVASRQEKKSKLTSTLTTTTNPSQTNEPVGYDTRNNSVVSLTSTISERRKSVRSAADPSLPHECPHCDAAFKVKGYLTRHLKKHSPAKAFVCPFFQEPCDGNSGTKCHPTGGFSRRDTFKTHLKALHFIYPPGTKSNERSSISGRCAGCFMYFENNFVWLARHIESGECKGTVQRKLQAHKEQVVTKEVEVVKVKSEYEDTDLLKEDFDESSHFVKKELLD
ncbi:zinc finger protein involved in pre-tRNA splicing [Scheffersomyces stipitis CBS 6054]|uniref:Zinc finger protein involved in pre-tRNA splicing n=1 Tax=Scheffersomyces stipitis (strain ATCC 58785 / CBS 6054 / NBRC 10063 / NRRL Y-11545) TaxID=322104 RepID=A3GHI6_PICST|nr:zinc finger protein involved in pre-tRNA splicing [Scheffersomyces stipitis CBS 6054]EAZ62825.2 zinc finger protein involved in pre-tRNA splicing [Scheffersomyces stipitis CBS 6054]